MAAAFMVVLAKEKPLGLIHWFSGLFKPRLLEPTVSPSKKGYEIVASGQAIKCQQCQRTSWNPDDVRYKYCGFCHQFHDR